MISRKIFDEDECGLVCDGAVFGDAGIFEVGGEELLDAALNVGGADDGFAACGFGVGEAGGIKECGVALTAVVGVNGEASE